MRISSKLEYKLLNKALEHYGVKIEDILKEEAELLKDKKKKKELIPYYLKYPHPNKETYEKWKKYCLEHIKKEYPGFDAEMEFNMFDCLMGPAEPYLFGNEEKLL